MKKIVKKRIAKKKSFVRPRVKTLGGDTIHRRIPVKDPPFDGPLNDDQLEEVIVDSLARSAS